MRRVLLAALAACAAVLALAMPASANVAQPHIIGGGDATETYSFMVSLDNGCGGSLVAAQWIVTAHHCGDAYSGRIGSTDNSFGGEVGQIDQVITKPGTDLTLMHLSQPAQSTPVPMAQSNPAAGSGVRLIGWGCQSWPDCQTSSTLQEIDLTILPSSDCAAGGGGSGDVCVSGDYAHSACHGDSGGPAIVGSPGNWTLVGETHGPGDNGGECATSTLYTGIAQYLTWINQQIRS
ncbi:trypsin-like serine protease [Solihabitans fulvus]|uniref:Trypsin-like serine protease n=1 Tax=Solihabitans fulvus TaxID=1892852 RepID=A0A5B2XEM8_9PSEU|nr:trypsin-like serine protease [Solihabitans fulvus]KAA2261411.1 trypsin-like serine protease [Solihabitans fulvus]